MYKVKKFIVEHISDNLLAYLVLIMKYKRVNNIFKNWRLSNATYKNN